MKFGITGMGAVLITALLGLAQPALAVESPYDPGNNSSSFNASAMVSAMMRCPFSFG